MPSSSAHSRWYHYQTIVTPSRGTRFLRLCLYADAHEPGSVTINEYANVVIQRTPVIYQPVVVASPRKHERPAAHLYTVGDSFSPDWIGPLGEQHVEVDGLRNGWLGPQSKHVPLRFGPSSWYLVSRFSALLAAGFLFVLALIGWIRRWGRISATAVTAPERKHG